MAKVRAANNERLKMVASAFSNIGMPGLALGFLPPYLNNTSGHDALISVGTGFGCALALHIFSWWILGLLRD